MQQQKRVIRNKLTLTAPGDDLVTIRTHIIRAYNTIETITGRNNNPSYSTAKESNKK